MSEATILMITFPVPPGEGGDHARGIEQTIVNNEGEKSGSMTTLVQDKRVLADHIGGRIVRQGRDRRGQARLTYYYFVPVDDVMYILICSADKLHSLKFEPVFETMAASLKV